MSRKPTTERKNSRLPEELSRLSERGYDDKSLCKPEFLTGFEAIDDDCRAEIAESLIELIVDCSGVPPSHPDTKYIASRDEWQLKVKKENSDHRVYIQWDTHEQPVPMILPLFHADQTHI